MFCALEKFCKKLDEQELARQQRRKAEEDAKAEKEAPVAEPACEQPRSRKRKNDRRLDNWQFFLKERRRLTHRIMKRTGKTSTQILLNCSSVPEKAMIQRLFDQAERLSPENEWRKERLRNTFTKCGLNVSLPDSNALKQRFTVYGLPQVSKSETFTQCCPTRWFKSKIITQRFEEKKDDIYNLIKHFPEVQCLQVIGKAMTIHKCCDEPQQAADFRSDSGADYAADSAVDHLVESRDSAMPPSDLGNSTRKSKKVALKASFI